MEQVRRALDHARDAWKEIFGSRVERRGETARYLANTQRTHGTSTLLSGEQRGLVIRSDTTSQLQ